MSTTELFKKHFEDLPQVNTNHPQVEKFFEELNAECIKEDKEKQVKSTNR